MCLRLTGIGSTSTPVFAKGDDSANYAIAALAGFLQAPVIAWQAEQVPRQSYPTGAPPRLRRLNHNPATSKRLLIVLTQLSLGQCIEVGW